MNERNYCTECGTKLEVHLTARYHPTTGVQVAAKHCPNVKCEEGCGFLGHTGWSYWRNKCLNCGYVQHNY